LILASVSAYTPIHARSKIENATIDDCAIVHLRHCTPSNSAIGDVVKRLSHCGSLILHLSDVMQSDIPLITGAMKRMRKSTCYVVALQNQYTLPAMDGKQCRGR
jgi:hypothetical protein